MHVQFAILAEDVSGVKDGEFTKTTVMKEFVSYLPY